MAFAVFPGMGLSLVTRISGLFIILISAGTRKRVKMEEKIIFLSENVEIEGLINKRSDKKAVVITHPHPLYGGDMYNYIVGTIARAYQEHGYSTLRFNFRGVGKSRGFHDEGKGEKKDVCAAFDYLVSLGLKHVDIAGYSFGAWVNAHISSKDVSYENMVMVSPPVGFMDFQDVTAIDHLKLVVTGSLDEIAPAHTVEKRLPAWNPNAVFKVIERADHFYTGTVDKLETVLIANIS